VTAQEGGGSGQVPSLLAERARSECARSMRAVEGNLGRSLRERWRGSEGPRPRSWHVLACQWVGGWESCAQWKSNQSPSL